MTEGILSLPPQPANQRIAYGDDPNQFLDLYLPSSPRAVVIMIHGGFWRARYDLQHVSHICNALARSGLAVGNLEYRRVGNPGGGWPGTYQDVRAGFAAVQKYFGSGQKFLAMGHSAGGHLALRLAVDAPELAGVVALAPVAVLRAAFDLDLSNGAVKEFLRGTPDEVPENFEAACPSLHPCSVERILLHGLNDDTIPLSMSQEFETARQGDSGTVWLMRLDEIDHYDLIDPESRAWPIVHMDLESLIEG